MTWAFTPAHPRKNNSCLSVSVYTLTHSVCTLDWFIISVVESQCDSVTLLHWRPTTGVLPCLLPNKWYWAGHINSRTTQLRVLLCQLPNKWSYSNPWLTVADSIADSKRRVYTLLEYLIRHRYHNNNNQCHMCMHACVRDHCMPARTIAL